VFGVVAASRGGGTDQEEERHEQGTSDYRVAKSAL